MAYDTSKLASLQALKDTATGVFVGVTWLCTELFCEWNEPPYGRSGFQCSSTNPKPFAIVYYAENKKPLVPMDSIDKVER